MQKLLLKNNNFYLLLGYDLTNGLASQFSIFCLPYFVYDITQSATQTVFSFGIHIIPQTLFTLFGGSMIDYFNRYKILLTTSLLSGITLLVFSIVFFNLDVNTHLQAIFVLSFLLALYTSLDNAALEAAFPEYFEKEELLYINTLSSAIYYFRIVISPCIIGAMILFMGPKISLLLTSFLYLLSFVIIRASKPKRETSIQKKFEEFGHLLYEHIEFAKKGLLYVLKPECPIQLGIFMSVLSNLFLGAQTTLTLSIAKNYLGIEVQSFAFGATAILIITGVILLNLIKGLSKYHVLSVMAITITLDALFSVCVGLSTNTFLLFASYYGSMLSTAIYCIVWTTFRQSYVPSHMRGRVIGICRSCARGFLGIGALISNTLLNYMDARSIMVLGGLIVICIGIIAFVLKRFYPTGLALNIPSSELSSTTL